MPRLQWTVVSGDAVAWAAAAETAAPSTGARLPSRAELVEALVGEPAVFPFGVEGAVWAADGGRVDPASEEISIPGPAPEDALARVVFATEAPVERPAGPRKRKLTVHGYMDDAVYQQCCEAAAFLNAEYSDEYSVSVEKAMGFEFERRRDKIAAEVETPAEEVQSHRVLVHDAEARTVMAGDAFIAHIVDTTNFRLFDVPASDPQSYANLARASLKKHLAATGSKFAWMLIKIDDQVAGRIVFELYSKTCPKTALNFLHLCRGDLPDAKGDSGKPLPLHYKGSKFYRVVKGGWVQGGDIVPPQQGNGGHSIYGPHFPDETFDVPHDDAGTLGMCNDGEHTNRSSFYVTMKKAKWMDGRYVAFGRVVEGLNVVKAIHDAPVRHNQTPAVEITIADCGDVALDG